MGQEIHRTGFTQEDFQIYRDRLVQETDHLQAAIKQGRFDDRRFRAGFELEAWLLDHAGFPSPVNEPFLKRLDNPWVVQELSRFNVELNGPPVDIGPGFLYALESNLLSTWQQCQEVAHGMDAVLAMVGILPNLRDTDLSLDNMSAMKRYVALNREVQRLRDGAPIHIHIEGEDVLDILRPDVMLEAATTSFQVHLQVPHDEAGRYYNAALISCGPITAASGNSPLLFGRRLWQETRIPLFEQSVELGGYAGLAEKSVRRVGFGQGYVADSLMDLFHENVALYPILLPIPQDDPLEDYAHVRLHNGTIWRWVRPLIGWDEVAGGHVRLEQRVLPSGPTVLDMVANAAFYFGLCHGLANLPAPAEHSLVFESAKDNFYGAARLGLDAELVWLDGRRHGAAELILNICLPMAQDGLEAFGLSKAEAAHYLEIVAERVRTGLTGAVWQRGNLDREQGDLGRMMANYLENQRTGLPVHEWSP